MDYLAPIDDSALIAGEAEASSPAAAADDLAGAVMQMRAGDLGEGRMVINAALIAAYQAPSSRHSFRAIKSDLAAFDLWCRRHNRISLPAPPETMADYLDART